MTLRKTLMIVTALSVLGLQACDREDPTVTDDDFQTGGTAGTDPAVGGGATPDDDTSLQDNTPLQNDTATGNTANQSTAQSGGADQDIAGNTFSQWDRDRDGQLAQDEWDEGVRAEGPFTAWDSNNDGMLSEDEFNQALAGAGSTGDLLDQYDQDGNDTLSQEEFSTLYEERLVAAGGQELSQQELDQLFSEFDQNQDMQLQSQELASTVVLIALVDPQQTAQQDQQQADEQQGQQQARN
ncbi:MAG: EF-hand domain-containing protein [Pseudohongiellaceae bacterium]